MPFYILAIYSVTFEFDAKIRLRFGLAQKVRKNLAVLSFFQIELATYLKKPLDPMDFS